LKEVVPQDNPRLGVLDFHPWPRQQKGNGFLSLAHRSNGQPMSKRPPGICSPCARGGRGTRRERCS
jgi:hypothetical protein